MEKFNVIAFTHAGIGLEELGNFHLETDEILPEMLRIKMALELSEIMYLSTCNRVEFIFTGQEAVDQNFILRLIESIHPNWEQEKKEKIVKKTRFWNGINAVNHLIEVASSLDSMVLGEREIITQVKNSYNFSKKHQLSGDTIRLVIRQTIETAKKVYTETTIAEKSVSVVSLAYLEFKKQDLPKNAKILFVGAGITNQNMAKFLKKDGYNNIVVFNRTLANAEKFAGNFGGEAYALAELANYDAGFDAIISCTSSNNPVITPAIYTQILKDSKPKQIVDLAIPTDVSSAIIKSFSVKYTSVDSIKRISDKNLLSRKKELLKARQIIFNSLEDFKSIFEMRQIEIKMRAIPNHVKAIRSKAMNEVFSKEMAELDDKSKEVLDKILNYMEKKYVSVPMIMAKEMLKKTK